MKKSFLLLPVSIAILTACSSNSPAPIENVDGTLSPGVMQPVDNNSSGTWQPEIQQNTMPSTMGSSVPTGTQTPQPSFQPTYQPVQQPTATQPQPAPAPGSNRRWHHWTSVARAHRRHPKRFLIAPALAQSTCRVIQIPTHRITAKFKKVHTREIPIK